GLSPVPDEPLPPVGTLGFRVQRYGMLKWGDLFTARQKLALSTTSKILTDRVGDEDSRDTQLLLACLLSRCVDYWSARSFWVNVGEFVSGTAGRHAIPPLWDFAEVAPYGDGSGNFDGAVDWICRIIDAFFPPGSAAH